MMFTTNGTPAEIAEFLDSPRGARTAHALAKAIYCDADRLAAFELGENPELHPVVERIVLAKIEARNARDNR